MIERALSRRWGPLIVGAALLMGGCSGGSDSPSPSPAHVTPSAVPVTDAPQGTNTPPTETQQPTATNQPPTPTSAATPTQVPTAAPTPTGATTPTGPTATPAGDTPTPAATPTASEAETPPGPTATQPPPTAEPTPTAPTTPTVTPGDIVLGDALVLLEHYNARDDFADEAFNPPPALVNVDMVVDAAPADTPTPTAPLCPIGQSDCDKPWLCPPGEDTCPPPWTCNGSNDCGPPWACPEHDPYCAPPWICPQNDRYCPPPGSCPPDDPQCVDGECPEDNPDCAGDICLPGDPDCGGTGCPPDNPDCGAGCDPDDPDDPDCGGGCDPDDPDDPDCEPGNPCPPDEPDCDPPDFEIIFFELIAAERDGDVAYMSGEGGLFAADLSDPGVVAPISVEKSTGRVMKMALGEDYIWCLRERDTIAIGRPDDGELPEEFYPVNIFGHVARGAAEVDGLLYTAAGEEGLSIWDATTLNTNNGNLARLGGVSSGFTNANDVRVKDDVAYVVDGEEGLVLVDVSNPTNPAIMMTIPTTGVPQDLDIEGDVVWMSLGAAGFMAVDITVPEAASVLGQFSSRGTPFGVEAQGDMLYVAAWSTIEIYDVTNPEAPSLVTREEPRDSAFDLVVTDEGAVAVADWYVASFYQFFPARRGAELYVPVRELRFPGGEAGETVYASVTLYNDGQLPLEISDFSISGPDNFLAPEGSLTIPPGGFETIEVGFEIIDPVSANSAFLNMVSNDPDEPEPALPLVAGGVGLQIGDKAPDFTLDSMSGEVYTLSEQEGKVVMLAYFTTW